MKKKTQMKDWLRNSTTFRMYNQTLLCCVCIVLWRFVEVMSLKSFMNGA